MKARKLAKAGLLLLVLFATAVPSFAFIVSAPAVEAQLATLNAKTTASDAKRVSEFGRTMAQWTEQIGKMREVINLGWDQVNELRADYQRATGEFTYWKGQVGDWSRIVANVRTSATQVAVNSGTFSGTAGMGGASLYNEESTGVVLGNAVDKLQEVMAAKEEGKQVSGQDVRELLVTLVGDIPETQVGGVAAMAQVNMEDTIAFVARANNALGDIQKERERIRKERDQASSGGQLTEAQKAQYDMADQELQSQSQNLQTQALLRLNQMMVVDTAFKTQALNRAEEARREQSKQISAFGGLIGFGKPPARGQQN